MENIVKELLQYIGHAIYGVWNYTIYTTIDKQTITFANVVVGLVLFVIGLKLARYLSKLARTKILTLMTLEPNVKDMLESIIHYGCVVLMTILVLDISHVPLTVFTFIGGTLAISIGLGSQNILNNFISGLIIIVEQPIRIGDYVEIDNMAGKVVKIGARCINIRTANNIDVLLPNSNVLQNKVINWTLSDDQVKVTFNVPVKYNSNTRLAQTLISGVLKANKDILQTPEPQVYFSAFAEEFLQFSVTFWVKISSTDRDKTTSNLNHSISEALAQNSLCPEPRRKM